MKCKKCKQEKEKTDYYKHPSWKTGYNPICKDCIKNTKVFNVKKCPECKVHHECKEYKTSKIRIRKCKKCTNKKKKFLLDNRDKVEPKTSSRECKKCKKNKKNEEFGRSKSYVDNINVVCKDCRREPDFTFSKRHCTKCDLTYHCEPYKSRVVRKRRCTVCVNKANNEQTKRYRLRNRDIVGVRNLIGNSFRRYKDNKYIKSERTETILGCTLKEATEHLETTFQKGMSWENHGRCKEGNCDNVWHIDHIIPISTSNTEEELIKLCHYLNLQALWAEENLKKGNKK